LTTALILGASGRVGSHLVRELDRDHAGVDVRLATSRPETAEKWRAEGRDAVVIDLNRPEDLPEALKGVDRIFLLTGYTSDMLYQSKKLVDAAADAGVSHIVHLGVFGDREDRIPHFAWHQLVETYIEASGTAWTHLHPNVIADTTLVTDPPIPESGSFVVFWKDAPQGWVFSRDIAAVAAAVLREGPEKHGGANYWLSVEVLTGTEVAHIVSKASGKEIRCLTLAPDDLRSDVGRIPSAPERAYMESAVICMERAAAGEMEFQTVVRDDVQTVLGRPGTTVAQWAREHLRPAG
jgi:uncharacterized protein YbjT (DUF2867 family)